MQSGDLAVFAAVAKAGSIGRAAVALNTVQSDVTGRILAFERSLGTPLFYRGPRGVSLTPAGTRLLPYATQIANLLAGAAHAVAAEGRPTGPLRIGSLETTAALRLPPLLSAYARRFPEVDIEFEAGPAEALVGRVLDRAIKGAFVSGPVDHVQLSAIPVTGEDLVLAAPPDVADFDDLMRLLSDDRGVKMLVFRTGCSYRRRLEELLAARGLVHVRRMEFGTLDGIIGCVEAGMGVTLIPRVVAEPVRRQGRVSIHALPDGTGRALTLFVHRTDNFATAAFSRSLEAIEATFPTAVASEAA